MAFATFEGLHASLTARIIKVFYSVVNELGGGFMESVYRRSMLIALHELALHAEEEVPVPVHFHGRDVGVFYADLVVEGLVILELKAADLVTKQHKAQLTHYLRSTELEVGLVLAFSDTPHFERVIFTNDRKRNLIEP